MQQVLAYIEGYPHIVQNGDVHNGSTRAHELAYFGEYLGYLTGSLCNQVSFLDVRFNFGHSSFGTFHQGSGSGFVLAFRTVLGHIILGFGGFLRSPGCIALGGNFVKLLCRHHALVVQVLHTRVGFFGNLQSGQCLLPHFIGSLYLFPTGAF